MKCQNIQGNKLSHHCVNRALLEEYAQVSSWSNPFEDDLDAVEKNGIWRVYNVVERTGTTEDGNPWVLCGGGVYVEFRKSSGEVLRFGVDD